MIQVSSVFHAFNELKNERNIKQRHGNASFSNRASFQLLTERLQKGYKLLAHVNMSSVGWTIIEIKRI